MIFSAFVSEQMFTVKNFGECDVVKQHKVWTGYRLILESPQGLHDCFFLIEYESEYTANYGVSISGTLPHNGYQMVSMTSLPSGQAKEVIKLSMVSPECEPVEAIITIFNVSEFQLEIMCYNYNPRRDEKPKKIMDLL